MMKCKAPASSHAPTPLTKNKRNCSVIKFRPNSNLNVIQILCFLVSYLKALINLYRIEQTRQFEPKVISHKKMINYVKITIKNHKNIME